MSGKKRYDPKSAFDDRGLPEKANSFSADKEEEMEKKARPLIKASLNELRKKNPDLFKGNAMADLVNNK